MRGEITVSSSPTSIPSSYCNQAQEILNCASSKDMEEATRRYEIIEPYLQTNRPKETNTTIRRWINKYLEAEKVYGNGYLGLLPRNHAKGNYNLELGEEVRLFMALYIKEHYQTPQNRRVTAVYRTFKEACLNHEPPFSPPSEKTFRLEIKKHSGYEQTLARQGSRVAKSQKPFHPTQGMPRHGDLPWESAHIDHTQLDQELVSSLISLATCNSSLAITVNKNLGRPWATFMIDSYTRRLLSVYITYEPPSYRSCMMVMRICVKRFNRLPQTLITDNGKEFHSIYFKQLLAYCKLNHKFRPPGEPRYGSPVERVFNTTNTQWVHELSGNTQIMRQPRKVTSSVNPKNHAVWTLAEYYKGLEHWAYEIYDKREHSTLGQSPREAFETGIALGGSREFRKIEYDETFQFFALPSPEQGKTRVVQPGQGVKIAHFYYWCDAFKDPEIEKTSVEVKCHPFNAGIAYAFVKKRWHECISDYHYVLKGRTEKEIEVITQDLRRRKSSYGKRVEISDQELVAHINSAYALEGELSKNYLQAKENKMVIDIIDGKNPEISNTDSPNSLKSKLDQKPDLGEQSEDKTNIKSQVNRVIYGDF